MADNPKHVEKFISYSTVQAKPGLWKSIVVDRIEFAKFLIANSYNVDPDKVKSIFLSAWENSTKDYPSPKYARPQNTKEWESFNSYILYLWEYYVGDKGKKKELPKEPQEPKQEKPSVDDSDNLEKDVSKDNKDNKAKNKEKKDDKKPGLVLADKKQDSNQSPPPSPDKEKIYDGVGEEDLVDEEIDDRILKLLGLTDIFDLDYGTYLSLLKERLLAARMTGSEIPTEEAELLTNEWKRVKGKVGRFRIKKKKIDSESFGGGGALAIRTEPFFAAQRVVVPEKGEDDGKKMGLAAIAEDIAAIRKSVESIVGLMTQQFATLRKEIERDRRKKEDKKRKDKESLLEKGGKAVVAAATKLLAPVKNILDRIIQFLTAVFLGRMVLKLFRWLTNPQNKKRVDTILRFIKDWWPALLAGFLLFGTSAGALIRTVIGTLTKMIFSMTRKGIPMLMRFIAKNPVASALIAGGALAAGGAYMASQQNESERDQANKKDDKGTVTPQETREKGQTPGASQLMQEQIRQRGVQMFKGGGLVLPTEQNNIAPALMSNGGFVSEDTGEKITGAGKDTQLTALQKGEVVISKRAVDKYGANFFLSLNKAGGGTNMPRMVNRIQLASGGGMVGGGDYNFDNKFNIPSIKSIDSEEPISKQLGSVFSGMMSVLGMISKAQNLVVDRSRRLIPSTTQNMKQMNVEKTNMGQIMPSQTSTNFVNARNAQDGKIKKLLPIGPSMDKEVIPPPQRPGSTSSFLPLNQQPQNSFINEGATSPAQIEKTSPKTLTIPAPPQPKVNVTHVANEQLQKVKSQKSVGSRDLETSFDAIYPSTTRSTNIAIYGILGVV